MGLLGPQKDVNVNFTKNIGKQKAIFNPSAATILFRTTMMWVRNSKNTDIFMHTDFTEMTDASLWGPKKTPRMPIKVNLKINKADYTM